MPGLFVPSYVSANAEREAVVQRQLQLGFAFTLRLQELDPDLECVFVGERAPAYPEIVPGRWHVVHHPGNGTPDRYIPIVAPDGGYAEPHDGILEHLRKFDLHRAGALDEMMGMLRRQRESAERSLEERREGLREEFKERFLMYSREHSRPTNDLRFARRRGKERRGEL